MLSSSVLLIFPAALALAAATDLLTMTIPNRLSLALALAFAVAAPVAGLTWAQIGTHVAVGAAVLALGVALFAFNLFGGGDAKLLAAVALWIGLDPLLSYVVMVAIAGGMLSVLILGFRAIALPPALYRHDWIARLHAPKSGIPYGIALAAAGLWIYPKTSIFLALSV